MGFPGHGPMTLGNWASFGDNSQYGVTGADALTVG
jgi:hypothetical protein